MVRTEKTPRNFLFTSFEGGGSVSPALTVVKKLVARGDRGRFMSDKCNRPEAEAAGAAFRHWTRAPSRADRLRETDILRDWDVDEPRQGLVRLVERIMAGPALRDAQDVIEEMKRGAAPLGLRSG